MSKRKGGTPVGADTTGKAVSRTSKLRSTDAGSDVPGGRPSVYSGQTEAQWAQQVEDLALIGGWRVYRVTNSTREIVRQGGARVRVRNVNASGVGFPDLCCVNARRRLVLFIELKRGKQKGHHHGVTPEQESWLADLRAVATDADSIGVYVWTPSDLAEVTAVLIGKVD